MPMPRKTNSSGAPVRCESVLARMLNSTSTAPIRMAWLEKSKWVVLLQCQTDLLTWRGLVAQDHTLANGLGELRGAGNAARAPAQQAPLGERNGVIEDKGARGQHQHACEHR